MAPFTLLLVLVLASPVRPAARQDRELLAAARRGDAVCGKRWAGSGFCAQVEDRREALYHLRVLRLEGCGAGCAPDPECSAARPVGGTGADAVRAGVEVVVPSWCLTQTAVAPPR